MKVGFFAPMPPARTGVADYAVNVLAALRLRGEVQVNPSRGATAINLYHLGNNALHREIYLRALQDPGIAVLHDAVLHHFLLGTLTRERYQAEFRYNYGEWSDALSAELWSRRGLSASDERYFEYPMLRRICETSRAVIVHNPAAARVVHLHAPAARVLEIPHIFVPGPVVGEADVLAVRRELGIPGMEPLCSVFGYLRETKRLRSVIEACGAAGMRLLIAGTCPNDLAKALGPLLRVPWVIRREFTDAKTFGLLQQAVDICANLRYPSARETSGISINLMGVGKAVLVSEAGENERYPADACVRIQTGLPERDHLTTVLRWLREFPAHARALGARAAAHVRTEHCPDRVSELYWSAIREVA